MGVGILDFLSKREKKVEYEFHKWKKQLIIADKAICVLVIISLGLFRPDLLVIAVYFMLFPYLILTSRKIALYYLILSSIIALTWMLIANNQYGYNVEMLTFFGLSSFPLFAWASGLFATYLIYSHWEHKFKFSSPIKKMLFFVVFYWIALISVETIVYHVFDIKNLLTVMYVGLPICDCIHAPRWMQLSYLLLGPIYFGICELTGFENPHYVKKTNKE